MHSIQSFDCTKLFKDLGHDLQRLTDLASRARHELPHHILTMRELISAGRIPGVEFSAHLLSTLLDSLLAGPSADAARKLERAASRGDENAVDHTFVRLEVELDHYLGDLSLVAAATA